MKSQGTRFDLKDWLKPGRLIPILTIFAAGTAIVLSMLGIIPLTPAESIIVALLALLSVDALTERLGVLERLEAKLELMPVHEGLRKRSEIPLLEERARNASDICILAVSAISLTVRYLSFLEGLLHSGSTLRVILLDPASDSLRTWELLMKVTTSVSDIRVITEGDYILDKPKRLSLFTENR